jgi:hypothetical protein
MKRSTLGLMICLVLSCTSDKFIDAAKYEGQEQLLTLNEFNRDGSKRQAPVIKKISPDSASAGNEFLAKIFIADSSLKITDAFYKCQSVQTPAVDTITHKVRGCTEQLLVKNDTIFIGFRPIETGLKEFPVITILTTDHDNIFRTYEYRFQYNVTR